MLELIQQEDWHGLTVYVAVRVAIVLICWVFLAMATFIDMYYGRKAAKAAGEGLRSRKYRRTFNKIGDYIRVMVFALMFDFLAGLFTWYVAPFATVVYTISAVLIEFISVREKLQNQSKRGGSTGHNTADCAGGKRKGRGKIVELITNKHSENGTD